MAFYAEQLLNGLPVQQIPPNKIPKVITYFRSYKQKILSIPDYFQAQKIDAISSELHLYNSKVLYSEIKDDESSAVEKKIEIMKANLDHIKQEHENYRELAQKEKEEILMKLEEQQNSEIEALENQYSGEPPPKYKKLSSQCLNMMKQEQFLKQAGRYIEAQAMREEFLALQAYELEVQKIQWKNEGIDRRNLLIEKHKQQTKCATEKADKRLRDFEPLAIQEENHYLQVISNLEADLNHIKMDSDQVSKETDSLLSSQLPPLHATPEMAQRKVPRSPNPRVTSINNSRLYTRRSHRAKTSI